MGYSFNIKYKKNKPEIWSKNNKMGETSYRKCSHRFFYISFCFCVVVSVASIILRKIYENQIIKPVLLTPIFLYHFTSWMTFLSYLTTLQYKSWADMASLSSFLMTFFFLVFRSILLLLTSIRKNEFLCSNSNANVLFNQFAVVAMTIINIISLLLTVVHPWFV